MIRGGGAPLSRTGGCHGYIACDAEVSTVPIRDRELSARKMLVLARFENNLRWAASLDGLASFARMPLVGKQLEWFERTAF